MGVPQVKTCCCGCTLETGALIIGWLNIIGGLIYIGSAIFSIVNIHSDDDGLSTNSAVYIIEIISGIIGVIISACLIAGVNKRSHKLLRFWVIITTIGTVFYFLSNIIVIIQVIVAGLVGLGLTSFIALAVGTALTCYFIIVVNSLYREILGETQPTMA